MAHEIRQWKDIADQYGDALILGNGASVAVSNTFSYSSLLEHAVQRELISEDVKLIFDFFKTKDFELVLRTVWQATNINAALKIENKRTKEAYLNVRESLIRAVRDVHPQHAAVAPRLPAINEFLKKFKTVFSLNYDLIVYWTMMYGFRIDDQHSFKDCFLDTSFADDWERLREPIRGDKAVTLVFYPHGSLALCRTKLEQERKIHGGEEGLLDAILDRWETEQVVPLFVSEGTSEQKVSSIRGSFYLSTIYREVLRGHYPTLTIYGWSLSEHDVHILERMKVSGVKQVAVSVYQGRQADCANAARIIADKLGADVVVEFFDSASEGCWINAS